MPNLIGLSIGRYNIVEKIGEGGMATVYKAYDSRLDRFVAIKMIHASGQDSIKLLKRFEREAKALARLSHPNIVKVLDYGEHENSPYLVMEFLSGGTLKQRLNGIPIPPNEAARLIAPVAHALEYAHSLNIVHRDVKPSNILFTESGQPMLTDFGIAKILDVGGETTELTATGTGIGTPDYMSPEQGMGKEVDNRSDVYSLGIIYYEMITGKKPFEAKTPMAIILKHVSEIPMRPRDIVKDIPESVEIFLSKAIAKEPTERFQSHEFALELENFINNEKVPPTRRIQITSPIKRGSTTSTIFDKPAPTPQSKPFPTALKWVIQIIIIFIAVMCLVGGLLSIAGTFGLSSVVRNAVSNSTFYELKEPTEQFLTEDELSASVTDAIKPYMLDLITGAQVDFQTPDTVILSFLTKNSSIDVEIKVENKDGKLVFSLLNINKVPLIIIGGILSKGINDGFSQALTNLNEKIDQLTITNSKLTYTVSPVTP